MTDALSFDTYRAEQDGPGGLRVDTETMFSDHAGQHKPRVEKRQRKLASQAAFLKDLLEDGERVLTITRAVSPTSFLEQWTTGLIFIYLKRCMLVFTDRRILHVPTTSSYGYRGSVAQVRYGDLASIAQKGSRLKIEYKSGTKEQLLYLRRAERKKVRALLASADLGAQSSRAGRRVHICPQCTAELEVDRFDCASCGKAFKNRARARSLSIWLPGGGYFYTGHPLLGIADAALEIALLVLIVVSLVPSAVAPGGDLPAAAMFAALFAIEKAITVYHADQFIAEYLPADRVPVRRSPVRLALGTVGTLALVAMIGLSAIGFLAPSDRVLSAEQVSPSHYKVLRAEGIIEDGEKIEFFYSEGLLSVKEGGSLLTNQRVIAYEQSEGGQVESYYIPNDEIVSVTLIQQGDTMNYSVYEVAADAEDSWIQLWLPHEYGDGERFANAVRAKIGN